LPLLHDLIAERQPSIDEEMARRADRWLITQQEARDRLRDSHVGRSGHWVDIQVRGIYSDADLALIEWLAQAVDRRPVIVRRACEPASVAPTLG
jgi:hypothetical protein